MMRSRKGQVAKLAAAAVILAILLAIAIQIWPWVKENIGGVLYGEEADNLGGSSVPQKPILADKITLRKAEVNGESLLTETYSAKQDGYITDVGCSGSCSLTLTYDRKIKDILDNDYFLVMELASDPTTHWRLVEGLTITLKGDKNEVLISGFEGDTTYFVRIFNYVDYTEDGTDNKYKLNSDHAVLRFRTS